MNPPTKSKLYAALDRLQREVAAERESALRWAHAAGRAAERTRKVRVKAQAQLRELRAQVRALSLALPNGATAEMPVPMVPDSDWPGV